MDNRYIPLIGCTFGATVAVWVIYQTHGIINNDGLLYVKMAQLIYQGNWREAVAYLNAPLYPALIAFAHVVSGFGFQQSANLLGVIFFAITCGGLIVFVRELGGRQKEMFATGLLLTCSSYIVGDLVPIIVRDHGYWAAHIWSLVFFLRYFKSHIWIDAFTWGLCAVIAALFRMEGLSYLFFLPMFFLIEKHLPSWQRYAHFLKANSVLLVIVLSGASVLFINSAIHIRDLGRLGEVQSVVERAYVQMQFGISEKARIYGDQVLGKFLENFATTGLLLTLFIALMTKAATSAGWVQLLLAIGRMRRSANNSLEAKYEKLLILLLLIGLVNVAFVILAKFVLSKRYLVPVALVIIVYAGFGLSALHSRVRQSVPKYKLMYLGVSLLIVCQFLVILWPTGTNKRFELAAVSWIVTEVAPGNWTVS
jgi:hypothetical protein